jgi:2Fe-2S ferredoxin
MPRLIVVDRSGTEHDVEARAGWTVMENIRDNGFDELLALCGGCCSCGTCHVHVDEDWLPALPQMLDNEDDLLDISDYRTENSRLSCQLILAPELDGLRVAIAPED